ncbi:MAG: helix-turn-helix domain-containing protein [Candidatus Bathyarchaeota archaeon]|nr:helix-turn-helix domain-containing protein [Candidatus Bathyarchaeota archaeon]
MEEVNKVEKLKEFKEKSGWSYEKIAQNIGVHSQAVQAWFRGTKPNNLTKKAIRKFLIKHSKIILNFTFMGTPKNEIVSVKLKAIPLLTEKAKWTMLGDSQHYAYEKFKEMLSISVFKKGSLLELYIVNKEIGQLEPIRINLTEIWPSGLTGGNVVDTIYTVNISKQMEKLGFL